MDGMSRRGILGALGASALAAIPFPWKPKPTDIVIASEMPRELTSVTNITPYATVVESMRLYEPYDGPRPMDMVGRMLYDKSGREVVLVTEMGTTFEVGKGVEGWVKGQLTSPMRHYLRQ
jgi:hypothetical protein